MADMKKWQKIERVAMAIAYADFEGEKKGGAEWTEQFEDGGLYAAQSWEAYREMAEAAVMALA